MTIAARELQEPRGRLLPLFLKPGNALPAVVWLFLVFNQSLNSPFPPSPSTVMLVLINSVALVLFILRRDPSRVGSKVEGLIALSGTFIVSLLEGPKVRDTEWLPTVIQVIALVGWGASLLALGRSFGLVPADRGLVERGPYRYLRHPIYAFEALFFVGYMIAVPTPRTAVIIAVWWALQVARILREERIIEGYEGYKRRIRWRVVPGIW